jgi:hypothetical protein
MMLDIEIKTIPHGQQRYETVGDWFEANGRTCIRISDCRNKKYEYMLAIHELVEKALCEWQGITMKDVDKFDFSYKGDDEPGDHPRAPYRDEHCFATAVERMLCAAMGLSWIEYERFLDKIK